MKTEEALKLFETYNIWLVILGLAFLGTTILPRIFSKYPLSMPIILLILGYAAVALPIDLRIPHPQANGELTEHLTELGVIISLMGAGLKIDRKFSFKGWSSTWRLLSITMLLTVALTAFAGWWLLAFAPATAILLGAVISPTDPVLASDVQVGAPMEGSKDIETEESDKRFLNEEDEVRFALTSEAGLNDGLAFPFTNMAIAMAMVGAHPSFWLGTWFQIHVLYEIGVAIIIGAGMGYLMAACLFSAPAKAIFSEVMVGLAALAATLLIYGVTEVLGGYGFIATFLGAVVIRNYNREHHFHRALHLFTEKIERIFIAIILVFLGGSIAQGLLAALNWQLILCAFLIVFLIRPLAGILGLLGSSSALWRERLAISFLGIKGIGSLYYLSYALNEAEFSNSDELWALVALTIVISIFVHGMTATPITKKLDKLRELESQNS